jgi:hypothetical protein
MTPRGHSILRHADPMSARVAWYRNVASRTGSPVSSCQPVLPRLGPAHAVWLHGGLHVRRAQYFGEVMADENKTGTQSGGEKVERAAREYTEKRSHVNMVAPANQVTVEPISARPEPTPPAPPAPATEQTSKSE